MEFMLYPSSIFEDYFKYGHDAFVGNFPDRHILLKTYNHTSASLPGYRKPAGAVTICRDSHLPFH